MYLRAMWDVWGLNAALYFSSEEFSHVEHISHVDAFEKPHESQYLFHNVSAIWSTQSQYWSANALGNQIFHRSNSSYEKNRSKYI